ncbi:hypothetical protein Anapl_09257 [Anas platyrhynchos]|uniref:Uncharacterized protein n=1 Tax=Anas platyrhynchos TaxID=8839 RepID=R0LYM1_ANAPL|nr:hypothetical protein Anapl_09257 [Anas platyrhynchos]
MGEHPVTLRTVRREWCPTQSRKIGTRLSRVRQNPPQPHFRTSTTKKDLPPSSVLTESSRSTCLLHLPEGEGMAAPLFTGCYQKKLSADADVFGQHFSSQDHYTIYQSHVIPILVNSNKDHIFIQVHNITLSQEQCLTEERTACQPYIKVVKGNTIAEASQQAFLPAKWATLLVWEVFAKSCHQNKDNSSPSEAQNVPDLGTDLAQYSKVQGYRRGAMKLSHSNQPHYFLKLQFQEQ